MHTQSRLLAKAHPHRSGGCTAHDRRTADMPATLAVLAAHKMSAERPLALDLARGGNFHSFAQTLMTFLLWHFTKPFKDNRNT